MEDIETSDEEEPKHGHDSAFVANSVCLVYFKCSTLNVPMLDQLIN